MSSLGEFLNAMVELRKNKAQVAEYNASQQMAGMESLGKGIGGFLGNLGEGMQSSQQDVLTNQLYNRANPPRAVAVGGPAVQGPADIAAASMPGGPLTAGGPFTGGVKGLQIQGVLDKADIARQRLADQQAVNEARIGHMGAIEDIKRTEADLKAQNIQSLIEARQARAEQKQQEDVFKTATALQKNATEDYKTHNQNAKNYVHDMKAAVASAAGAKTQADYDKALSLIQSVYITGPKLGFKDLAYPEIPIPAFQREDAQAKAATLTGMQANQRGLFNWGGSSAADIAKGQQELQGMPGYPATQGYQVPGLQDWQIPEPPTPPGPVADYMPGGSAYPGGPGSPQTTPMGPSQAAQQGPAPSAAAPNAIPTISLQEARKKNPNITPGLKTDKNGNQILIQ